MSKSSRIKHQTCPMLARSDWGVSHINSRGLAHCLSSHQSPVGFHGPKVAGWLIFLNGCHRGEDMRLPIGESKIGAAWQNDCVVTGVGVGSYHASISVGSTEATIVPASANRMIKINNTAITERAILEDGSLLTIGEVHCVFRLATAFDPGYLPTVTPIPKNMPAQTLPAEMVCGWLVFSQGPSIGQDFRLINGECRIGSQPGLEVCVPDANLSKHLVTLSVSSRDCKITWISDPKKIRVNGVEVKQHQSLKDSDIIEFDHLEAYLKWLQV